MELKNLTLEELIDLKVETLQQIENTNAADAERIGLERLERINRFIKQKTTLNEDLIDKKRREIFYQMMDVNGKITELQNEMKEEMEQYSKDIEERLLPDTQKMMNKLNDIQNTINEKNLELEKLKGEIKVLDELKKV